MNKSLRHTATLAAALSAGLLFAAGGALAHGQDTPPEQSETMGHGSDQPASDTWITTKVKSSLLADSDVAGLDVKVETVDGVVTLSGNVDSQAQVDRAVEIANGIEGVSSVDASGLVSTGSD